MKDRSLQTLVELCGGDYEDFSRAVEGRLCCGLLFKEDQEILCPHAEGVYEQVIKKGDIIYRLRFFRCYKDRTSEPEI